MERRNLLDTRSSEIENNSRVNYLDISYTRARAELTLRNYGGAKTRIRLVLGGVLGGDDCGRGVRISGCRVPGLAKLHATWQDE